MMAREERGERMNIMEERRMAGHRTVNPG